MPDKSQATPDGLFALSDHRLMSLSGRDAVAFAQAQFMNDVASLADGQWQWNGWLTPKGRVIALFALLRVDDQTLWMLVPDADVAHLAETLGRYVFRSKVVIALRGDLHVAGCFRAPATASGAVASLAPDPVLVELDMTGDGGPRAMYVLAGTPGLSPQLEAAWVAADLRHGLPRLSANHVEHWTPQQLSLERLKAFSVRKGCYPGQEIVARTHFLGKVKRGLILVEGPQSSGIGGELLADGTPLGTVVSSAADGSGTLGLAVVPLERDTSLTLTVSGAPVAEGHLLGGLAR